MRIITLLAVLPLVGIVTVLPATQPPPAHTETVIVITLDGVRWQEVFCGVDPAIATAAGMRPDMMLSASELMPNLHALAMMGATHGSPGTNPMLASGTPFSLPGYMEIFTGVRDVGCDANDCGPVTKRTFLDAARDRSMRDEDVAVFASWDRYERAVAAAPERIVISSGRHGGGASRDKLTGQVRAMTDVAALAGCEDVDLCGATGTPPGPPRCTATSRLESSTEDYRPDADTATIALAYFTTEHPLVLVVGLGDTDEYAHAGDYPSYLRAMREADGVIGTLRDAAPPYTSIIVTTDHGRGALGARGWRYHGGSDLASARVWMVASGGAVERTTDGGATHLAHVAPIIRTILAL